MAGLDPAIHDLNSEDVDARHKTGHDGSTLFREMAGLSRSMVLPIAAFRPSNSALPERRTGGQHPLPAQETHLHLEETRCSADNSF
jgi:hypothetical protein